MVTVYKQNTVEYLGLSYGQGGIYIFLLARKNYVALMFMILQHFRYLPIFKTTLKYNR